MAQKTYGFQKAYRHVYFNMVLAGKCLLKAYFHLRAL